jgi:hypothetical protein
MKCPECGARGAYVGCTPSSVECGNSECRHYHEEMDETKEPTSTLRMTPWAMAFSDLDDNWTIEPDDDSS